MKLAVIGAGNMGSGIAQKMATEGFSVTLIDIDADKVQAGLSNITATLQEGVQRKIFKPEVVEQILSRISATADWQALANVDLIVEAVFEDFDVKQAVLEKIEAACDAHTIIGTNTSSLSVSKLAAGLNQPARFIGLHYFYHPAKNRLVEVVPGAVTDAEVVARTWALQEQLGKTPIHTTDASGFIVNRYFVPWLNEAVRLLEQGVADIPSVDAAARQAFGVGMGPFELMNVTGVPIAMHSANSLGQAFGEFYAPATALVAQVDAGEEWNLSGVAQASKFQVIADRLLGVVFYIAAQLVDEQVGSIEDVDIGARVGLRWPSGPFELMNQLGTGVAAELATNIAQSWSLSLPQTLKTQAERGAPFALQLVQTNVQDGIATLTINRPDAMNALNEAVVQQLADAFAIVAVDQNIRGIVVAGSGKGYIAGADIRFFVKNIEANDISRIISFTQSGHDLLNAIDECPKPVIARMHGLTLGGGLEVALACDHIIASDKAVMAFPETGIGIYPGLGGTQRTSRRIGVGLTKYAVCTGQMISASEAAAMGLVDRVVAPDALDAAVTEAVDYGIAGDRSAGAVPAKYQAVADYFAEHDAEALLNASADDAQDAIVAKALKKLPHKAPIATRLACQLIETGAAVSLRAGLAMELAHLPEIFATADAYAGLKSVGGPPPQYEGR